MALIGRQLLKISLPASGLQWMGFLKTGGRPVPAGSDRNASSKNETFLLNPPLGVEIARAR